MFEIITTKGELYDKCENMEELYDNFYYPLLVEHKELKKQLENYKKLGFKHLQDKNNNLETQQKEFISYLEDEIKTLEKDILETVEEMDIYMKQVKSLIIEEILQKYRSIIGDKE